MKKTLALAVFAAALTLTGCGSMNSVLADRLETTEMYHIIDFKTGANADAVIKATADGLARNTNSIVQNRPLMIGKQTAPTTPGRFELVDPISALKGTGMGGFMAMAGGAGTSVPKVAKCDDAIWTAKATRSNPGYENLNLYVCIYKYADGYQLDMYGVFQKKSGGLGGLARDAASAMVGTPEQWINKTIVDTVRSVEAGTSSKYKYVEGQPSIGELPKLDTVARQ